MRIVTVVIALIVSLMVSSIFGQNPFGVTGVINDQALGMLDDRSVIFPSHSGFGNNQNYMLDPDTCLENYLYDIYIPNDYDGTEPYGLVLWVNSGGNGTVKNIWKTVLDEKNMIWIGLNNCGNAVYTHIRLSVAWAAVLRAQEILNIDSDRIFTSGSSGGARVANSLAYIYPEVIDGSVPLCGASYPATVPQDYETHDPNSNYEVILPFSSSDFNYIQGFDQRFCIMTSFDDFREGDIMNIYHGGHQANGNMKSKFVDHPGSHCATTTSEFRDALWFVESAFYEEIEQPWLLDEQLFNTHYFGEGYQHMDAPNSGIRMKDGCVIKSRQPFMWNNNAGAQLNITADLTDGPDASAGNIDFNIGLWAGDSHAELCQLYGNENDAAYTGILLKATKEPGQLRVRLYLSGVSGQLLDLYDGVFADWNDSDELGIKFHLWNKEMRVEFDHHFDTGSHVVSNQLKVLDDLRSLQLKWANCTAIGSPWLSDWDQGAMLTLSKDVIASSSPATDVRLTMVNALVDEPLPALNIPVLEVVDQQGVLVSTSGFSSYQWSYDGVVLTDSTYAVIHPDAAGEYSVSAVDAYGCTHTATYMANSVIGLGEWESGEGLVVYPNPTKDVVVIEAKPSVKRVMVYDALGTNITHRCVLRPVAEGSRYTLDMTLLERGAYQVVVHTGLGKLNRRVVKF